MLNYHDRIEKLPDENPTIGILLCAGKNDSAVTDNNPYLTTLTFFPFLSWCVVASGRVFLRPINVPSMR